MTLRYSVIFQTRLLFAGTSTGALPGLYLCHHINEKAFRKAPVVALLLIRFHLLRKALM